MKRKVIVAFIIGLTTISALPSAMAQTEVEDRIKQMEAEISALKALVQEQNEQNKTDIASIEGKVETAQVANSNLVTSKDTTLTYGGFIKVDGMWNDYDSGPRPGNIGDEILVPSTIPVGGEGEGAQFDSHIKTSRVFFKTATNTDIGAIKSHFELDLLTSSGDERISNSATSRVRHAYLSWDYAKDASLLIGQSWSTFFNVGALPESVEFIGPTSGTIFNRQTQIRWTKKMGSNSFMFALENPSTSLADAGSGIAGSNFDDNSIPDIIARYNGVSGAHSWTVSALGREIGVDDGIVSESDFGFAVNVAGKFSLPNGDDIKYSIANGNLGRYIGLNVFRDGGIDAAGNLDLTTVTGGYIAYRHHWNEKLRSTVQYAISKASLADGLSDTNSETVDNFNVNLFYSPSPKLSFGGAVIAASRELENGESGDLTRIQLMTKYAF